MNKIRWIILSGLVVVAVLCGALLLWREVRLQSDLALIRGAVETQTIGRQIGRGANGTKECYPSGRSKQCTAVTYEVSEDVCRQAVQTYGLQPYDPSSNEPGCRSADGRIIYKHKTVHLYAGEGNARGVYWLQSWVEE